MKTLFDEDLKAKIIAPQPGKQSDFCSSLADIVIYGGAAYGGKTVGLLIEAARNIGDERYTGVVFRRKYTEIVAGGGLWDTSTEMYQPLNGRGIRGTTEWTWPNGARIKFTHLNQELNIYDHQGSAYVFLGFDELTHFTKNQFFYLLTRNRPPAGCVLRPYCRATTNPEPGWVADLIQWWWNPETGYAIPERSGKIRYFTVIENDVIWVPPTWRGAGGEKPKSLTFIASTMADNPIGLAADPMYASNLEAQDKVTRERLKHGNWLITYSGGMFDPTWFEIVDEVPPGMRLVRYWDFAASEVSEELKNDPDWTAGALCGISKGTLYILDVRAFRETPGSSEKIIRTVAEQDGHEVEPWWEEEKGSSGKYTSEYLKKVFEGFESHPDPVSGSKVERARPWAAWAEFKRVKLLRGEWNRRFLGRVGKFPDGKRDEIDAVSGAFKALVDPKKVLNRYIPNADGHLRTFSRTLEDFQKVQPQNVEIYVSLWAEKDGGIYGGCFIWSVLNRRLRMYNEIFMPMPTAPELASLILEKLVVPLNSKTGWVSLTKIVGNEDFFNSKGESISKELRKAGIRVKQNTIYDENAAILRGNRMFAENQVFIHSDCVETEIQWRGWLYEAGKPAPGYPLARALCLIVSELRSGGKLNAPPMPAAYTKRKLAVRENLKSGGARQDKGEIDRAKKMYEYLLR